MIASDGDSKSITEDGTRPLNSIAAVRDDLHDRRTNAYTELMRRGSEDALEFDRIETQTHQVCETDSISPASITQILQRFPEAKTALKPVTLPKAYSTRLKRKAHTLSSLEAKHRPFPKPALYSNTISSSSIPARRHTTHINPAVSLDQIINIIQTNPSQIVPSTNSPITTVSAPTDQTSTAFSTPEFGSDSNTMVKNDNLQTEMSLDRSPNEELLATVIPAIVNEGKICSSSQENEIMEFPPLPSPVVLENRNGSKRVEILQQGRGYCCQSA